MNLWVKRIALGLSAAVALFLFACLDEEDIIGFKNQNQKFKVSYVEIPIESSVLLFDSLRTSNYAADPVKRLLVGAYSDPVFGDVQAEAYSQLVPSSTTTVKPDSANYDSVALILNFDLYHYGGNANATLETYKVHEVTERLTHRQGRDYYTFTQVAYDGITLGETSLMISDERLDSMATRTDTTVTLTIPLSEAYGQKLFDIWNTTNSTFTNFQQFSQEIKGLAITSSGNQKVVGFSVGANTKVSVYYHYPSDTAARTFNYQLSNVVSGSKITIDRAGTDLAGLTTPYQEYLPSDPNKLFIESGAPVVVKLDISAFENHFSQLENVSITSAELSIGEIDNPGNFDPPNSLFVQLLNGDNRLRKYVVSPQDTFDVNAYNNKVRTLAGDRLMNCNGNGYLYSSSVSRDSIVTVVSDAQCSYAQLVYDTDKKAYKGFLTLFTQELYDSESLVKDNVTYNKTKFYDLVLYPGNPFASKGVNRVAFNKDKLKLKIFYTTPITETE